MTFAPQPIKIRDNGKLAFTNYTNELAEAVNLLNGLPSTGQGKGGPTAFQLVLVKVLEPKGTRVGMYKAATLYDRPKPTATGNLKTADFGTAPTKYNMVLWKPDEAVGAPGLAAGQILTVYLYGFDEDGYPVGIPTTTGGVCYAKILSSVRDGSNYRWMYKIQQVQKTGDYTFDPVEGGFNDVEAININESANGASGALGNGIVVEHLPDGFEVVPVPVGTVVRVEPSGTRWAFEVVNGVDGECPVPESSSSSSESSSLGDESSSESTSSSGSTSSSSTSGTTSSTSTGGGGTSSGGGGGSSSGGGVFTSGATGTSTLTSGETSGVGRTTSGPTNSDSNVASSDSVASSVGLSTTSGTTSGASSSTSSADCCNAIGWTIPELSLSGDLSNPVDSGSLGPNGSGGFVFYTGDLESETIPAYGNGCPILGVYSIFGESGTYTLVLTCLDSSSAGSSGTSGGSGSSGGTGGSGGSTLSTTSSDTTTSTTSTTSSSESSSTSSYDPPTSGLVLWLDTAQDSALFVSEFNGSYASTLVDRSGNGGNATQASNELKPTWRLDDCGQWCVRFDGANDRLAGTISDPDGSTGYTVFIVARCYMNQSYQTNSQKAAFSIFEAGGWGIVQLSPFSKFVGWRFGTGASGNDPRYTRPSNIANALSITGARHNGTAETIWTSTPGSPATSASASNTASLSTLANNSTTYNLAHSESVVGQWDFYELLVYNRALSDSEMQSVSAGLAAKYCDSDTIVVPPCEDCTYYSYYAYDGEVYLDYSYDDICTEPADTGWVDLGGYYVRTIQVCSGDAGPTTPEYPT